MAYLINFWLAPFFRECLQDVLPKLAKDTWPNLFVLSFYESLKKVAKMTKKHK
jgi:hypothetical protein